MKSYRAKLLLTFSTGWLIFATLFVDSFAADCTGNWEHPISQHVEMRGMALSLDEYANNERHFSIKHANHMLDIYFLQDALLIKGPSKAEIEQYSDEELSWFPMAFAIPNSVLSTMSPKGPCSVKSKTRFSQRLPGTLRFGPHKLTHAKGEIAPTRSREVVYTFAATISPPLEGVASIQYSGSMRFARKAKTLAAGTNLIGYTLIGVAHPLPVVGDASLRFSTLGELRAVLARREPRNQDDDNGESDFKF
jgi:hypothetical protein